ncbi:hypothetical protein NHQ30_004718 [Ciborinia camelliae]|nr:hypothetical protein NHQ30_004718 [Ciborinia camelliae]
MASNSREFMNCVPSINTICNFCIMTRLSYPKAQHLPPPTIIITLSLSPTRQCTCPLPPPPPSFPKPQTPTLYFAYGSNLSLTQMQTRCPNSTYYGLGLLQGYRWIINERGYANIVSDPIPFPVPGSGSDSRSGSEDLSSSCSAVAHDDIGTLERETREEMKEEMKEMGGKMREQMNGKRKKDTGEKGGRGKNQPKSIVYGLLYTLTPADEETLDIDEGVPFAYTKTYLPITPLLPISPSPPSSSLSLSTSCFHSGFKAGLTKTPPKVQTQVQALTYIDTVRTSPSNPMPEYIHRMNRGIRDAVSKGMEMSYVMDVMRVFIPKESEDQLQQGGSGKNRARWLGQMGSD